MKTKRFLAGVLFFAMIMLMLPIVTLAETTAEVKYTTDGGVNWKEDSLINAIYDCYFYDGSEIQLLRDIILTGDNWIDGQVIAYKSVTINGNGYKITRGADIGIIGTVGYANSVATLKNITVDGGAVWSDGALSERTNSGLSYNNAYMFDVCGGTLVLDDGAVLCNSDLSNMDGGAVRITENAVLEMKEGSKITDCRATNGGAVSIINGTFNMSGGEISNNVITDVMGGGVLVYTDGIFNISGSPVIKDNKADAANNNVYLHTSKVINLNNALTNTEKIGITMKSAGTFTSGWNTYMGTTEKAHFVSDNKAYIVSEDGNELMLEDAPEPIYTISFDANGGSGTMDNVDMTAGEYNLPECSFTAPDGLIFNGWATSADGDVIRTDMPYNVTEDITLYAVWEPDTQIMYEGITVYSTGATGYRLNEKITRYWKNGDISNFTGSADDYNMKIEWSRENGKDVATITLKSVNANIGSDGLLVVGHSGLQIDVVTEANSTMDNILVYYSDVYMSGTGMLTINDRQTNTQNIYVDGDLIIDGADITAQSLAQNAANVIFATGNISIGNGSELKLDSASNVQDSNYAALRANGAMTIKEGSTVNVTCNEGTNCYALMSIDDLTIENSTVNVINNGSNRGISSNANINISQTTGTTSVIAASNGIALAAASGKVTVNGGTVNLTSTGNNAVRVGSGLEINGTLSDVTIIGGDGKKAIRFDNSSAITVGDELTAVGSLDRTAAEQEIYSTERQDWYEWVRVYYAKDVTITGTNNTVNYADKTFDVSTMFEIDDNAGTATYSVANQTGEAVLSSDGKTVELKKAGTVEVTVNTAANGNYNSATASAVLTIEKATPQTIIFPTPATITYGADLETSALTGGSGDGTFAWTDSSIIPTVTNNEYEITFTPNDTVNYDYTGIELTKTVEITVNPLPVNIIWKMPQSLVFDGNEKTITAELANIIGNDSVNLTIEGTTTATDKGEYTAAVTDIDNANYTITGGQNLTIPWAISEATNEWTTSLGITGWTYGETPNTPVAAARFGTVVFTYADSVDGTYTETVPTAAGTWYVKAVVAGTENYAELVSEAKEFTILPKTINPEIPLTAPVANTAPQTEIETDEYTATVVWLPEITDKFAYSTAYTATITITPKANYTLTGIDENSYTVDGAEIAANKADSGIATVTFAATGNKPDTTVWENPFTDVDTDDWYYADVEYVTKNGLFNGITTTTFAPDGITTRGMLVTVLYRNEGEPKVTGTATFKDVDKNAYYAKAVVWGQQNGIIKGYSESEFAPNDNITREQVAVIMHRYARYKGYDVSAGENTNIFSYTDFDSISEYAISSVQYAVGSGLMKGRSESTINPQDNATRAETAAIIHRFFEVNK